MDCFCNGLGNSVLRRSISRKTFIAAPSPHVCAILFIKLFVVIYKHFNNTTLPPKYTQQFPTILNNFQSILPFPKYPSYHPILNIALINFLLS